MKLTEKQEEVINNAPIHLYYSDFSGRAFYQSDNEIWEYRYSTIKSLIDKGLMEIISDHRTNNYPEFHLTDEGRKLIYT